MWKKKLSAGLYGIVLLLSAVAADRAFAWENGNGGTLGVRVEQDDPSVSYSCPDGSAWATVEDPQFSGGTAAFTGDAGCLATFTFTGPAVNWIGSVNEESG